MPGPSALLAVGDGVNVKAIRGRIERSVLTAATGEEALTTFQTRDICGVVTGQQLPDMTGVELIEQIRDTHPELPVILWTANGDEATASKAITAGVTEYISKRETPNERAVQRILATIPSRTPSHMRTESNSYDADYAHQLAKYQTMFETVTDGICVLNRDSEFIEVNDAFVELTGYSREDVIGAHASLVRPAALNEQFDEIQAALDAGSDIETIEMEIQTADGEERVIDARYAQFDHDGESGRIGVWRDITDQKEREDRLEAEKDKFQTLLEAAPDPVFVADAETGEIIETNRAACQLRGQSRDEILGLYQTDLHPADEEDRYRALFDQHVEQGGTITQFNGEQIYLTTADGDKIPVAISAETVTIGDRTLIYGIFRDISARKQYRETLKQLNTATHAFLEAQTKQELAQTTVEIATDVLDLDGTAVYFYDDENGTLTPTAYSPQVETLVGDPPTLSPGNSIAWRVYTSQEAATFDDVRTADDVYNPTTPFRSELIYPLGDLGVLLIGDTEIGAFDKETEELADLLATTVETALDRVAWAQQLQTQKQEAQRQAQLLTRANQINEKLRESIQAIIEADTRQEIEQAICTHLTEIDRFAFAWVGKPKPTGDAVTPVAWAGSNSEYIEDLSGHLDIDSHLPAVQTIREREPTNVSTVADAANQEPWRQLALLHEYQSAISVPIIHEETLYGALTIYATRPSAFDERSTAVLTDVGELVGYAIHVAEQQTAVVATEIVELTFALPTTDEPFVELASRLGTEVEILHISARDDGQYLVYVVANDSTASTFRKMVAETDISDDLRVIQERDGNTVVCEMIVSKACIATEIASLTGMADRFVFEAQSNHVTVSLPRTRDIQAFITRIIELYPDATVLNQEITDRTTTRLLPALTEVLTPRQQEVLQTAYYGGFFDQPRHSTGAELADALGISQPAFSKQLRKAEHKLLQVVYESES